MPIMTLAGGFLALIVLGLGPIAAAPSAKKIDLNVHQSDVRNVLGQLAEVAKLNLVLSDEVRGRVTVKLRQVSARQAMEVIARSQGLGIQRYDGVVFIDRLDRLTAYDVAKARWRRATATSGPLVTRLFPLSYARAADLAPLVKDLLSRRGRVTVDARTNTLIVTDVATRVSAVARQVSQSATPRNQ